MTELVSAPKTDFFRIRISPEVRRELEAIYAKTGLTLTDAVNVFFQQSLNTGGFPFPVTAENAEQLRAKSLARLAKELDIGANDPDACPEGEVYLLFGMKP